MLSHSHHSPASRSTARASVITGLLGAAMLFAPLAASAETTAHHHHHGWSQNADHHEESIEDRIATLHTNLQITPAQETSWGAVAQVMRDNETRMLGMVAAHRAEHEHHVDALEDLRNYEQFNQAHVDGVKLLRASFETLYMTMPDSQKLVADEVFRQFGHRNHGHG